MFLPVLLVRDYGVWGFVVFAVPNVIGAAAMGWVIADRARVRSIVARHVLAIRTFSWVTICFHVAFLAVYGTAFGLSGVVLIAVPPVILIGWLCSRTSHRWAHAVGALVYVASAALLTWHWIEGADSRTPLSTGIPTNGLLWLAPVCAFGFALCPYMDLTFWHAREHTNRAESRAAFGIGFGVLFLLMILGTLMYAEWADVQIGGGPRHRAVPPEGGIIGLISIHLLAQSLYTIWVHSRACAASGQTRESGGYFHINILEPGIVVALVGTGLVGLLLILEDSPLSPFDSREIAYRYFMGFYGLVFPAYVWLCMIPTRDGHSGIAGAAGRRKLTILTAAVILALPCFVLGFMSDREWWLAPGLGIVLAARLLIRRPADGGNPDPTRPAQTPTL